MYFNLRLGLQCGGIMKASFFVLISPFLFENTGRKRGVQVPSFGSLWSKTTAPHHSAQVAITRRTRRGSLWNRSFGRRYMSGPQRGRSDSLTGNSDENGGCALSECHSYSSITRQRGLHRRGSGTPGLQRWWFYRRTCCRCWQRRQVGILDNMLYKKNMLRKFWYCSGKSTLVGVLTSGKLDNGRGLARSKVGSQKSLGFLLRTDWKLIW